MHPAGVCCPPACKANLIGGGKHEPTSILYARDLRPCTRVTFVLLLGLAAASVRAEPYQLAQAEIRIPSDAQLERMERQGIVTPPLYDGGLGRDPGIAGADRQMGGKLVGSMRSSWAAASA